MRFSMLYSGEQILSFKPCLVFYAGDSLIVDFLETVEVFVIIVCMCSELNDYHLKSRLFFDLCPGSLRFHFFQTGSAPKTLA